MKLQTFFARGGAFCVSAMTLLAAVPTRAHVSMIGMLQSRGGDQKDVPCDGARSSGPVYTFEPGATIKLELQEDIAHPSYYRIAFDNEGEDGFVEPASIKPIESSRPCPYDANDKCGMSDFCNVKSTAGGPTVLWDNLDPHSAGASKGNYSWTIALPNVECENCTLQVIQVMEDTVHGAYCPVGSCATECTSVFPEFSLCSDGSAQDIYHRCINIKLKRGAGGTAGVTTGPAQNNGINCLAGQMATDGGVAPSDASVPQDAGTTNDSGATTGGTAGGTVGGAAGGGTTGGQAGVAGGVGGVAGGTAGGVAGGTAGGTSTTGGSVVAADGGAGISGGSAPTGGSAGTSVAGGTTAGGPGYDDPADDGCDCAVSDRSPRYGNLVGMGLLAAVLVLRRRRISQ